MRRRFGFGTHCFHDILKLLFLITFGEGGL